MKRFLIISTIIFILIANFIDDIATNRMAGMDDTYFTKIKGEEIYIAKNNKWEKFEIVGVNLDPAKPGVFPSENTVKEEEYLRWIQYIYDMGANCIKVSNLMSQHFYNALEKFNKDRENPIYLVQGIYFDETYLKDGYDPQDNKLKEVFKTNIKLIIDSVHGNPYNFDKPDIVQFYNTDISKYIIGYTLGIEFAKHDLIYTEIMNEKKSYSGKFLYTDDKASSFESYMAQMGDYLAGYELEMYKKQSLISFVGSSSYHIVSSRENPKGDSILSKDNKEDELKKYLNPENIKAKRKLKTGVFATYNIYPSYSEVREYQNNMDYYFKKIKEYHKIPVVIGEFGIPSARVAGDFNMENSSKGYINEKEQGQALADVYESIKRSNCAGSFIFEFQDSWHNSSWNTKESKILDKSAYWSDAQTYSQNFGIMAFDPGKKESVSYPDNTISDWKEEDVLNKNGNMSLSMKSDEKYLYLMLKFSNNLDLNKQDLYIDLDTTPKSGSNKSSQLNLEFDRPSDFIVSIKDRNDSKILVHEYYNGFNFYENKKNNQIRPDLIKHTPDMDEFSPIFIETRPKMYVESLEGFADKLVYETGKLVYGNANPKDKDFNSVSDFYIGENYIELRIPWGILNFMDPSTKQIQNDFYEEFKTKPLIINDINVGVTVKEGNKTDRLHSATYDLDGWIMPTYHERLKESYYVIKNELINSQRGK